MSFLVLFVLNFLIMEEGRNSTRVDYQKAIIEKREKTIRK